MRPGVSSSGTFFDNYTLEFDSKIEIGGIGWTVARISPYFIGKQATYIPIRHFHLDIPLKEYSLISLPVSNTT
jgi:hypothetical protein